MKVEKLPVRGLSVKDVNTWQKLTHVVTWREFESFVDEETARWLLRAIEFGKEEAKRELREFLSIK